MIACSHPESSICRYSTYEELKQASERLTSLAMLGRYSTYEELKPFNNIMYLVSKSGRYSTYEELKQDIHARRVAASKAVVTLPMRN